MTTSTTSDAASFSEQIRLFNSELIPTLVGKKITDAEAVNNLAYTNKAKEVSPKCGLLLTLEGGEKIGLFRWDLVVSAVEYIDDKPQPLRLDDVLHKAARANLKPGIGEKEWLEAIAIAVKDKTISSRQYLGKNSKGAPYFGVVLTVE